MAETVAENLICQLIPAPAISARWNDGAVFRVEFPIFRVNAHLPCRA